MLRKVYTSHFPFVHFPSFNLTMRTLMVRHALENQEIVLMSHNVKVCGVFLSVVFVKPPTQGGNIQQIRNVDMGSRKPW